jgi:hypothetical protein
MDDEVQQSSWGRPPDDQGPRSGADPWAAGASENLNELAAALAKAQGEIGGASKDAVNPHFRTSYATLASVRDACREPLAKNGLSVVQLPARVGPQVEVVTVLFHASGQWISSRISVVPTKNDAQGIGAAITYLRRYLLAAMVGVAPEDDDDAEAAVVHRGADGGPPRADGPEWNGPVTNAKRPPAESKIGIEVALKKILEARTPDEVDKVGGELSPLITNAADRKVIAAALNKRRVEVKKEGAPCEACGVPPGKKHADGCPMDPNGAREAGSDG